MAITKVTSSVLADGSVATATIADDAVTGAKIENAVTIATSVTSPLVDGQNFKINGGQGTDGQVLTSTGSGVAWEEAGGGAVSAVANGADNRIATFSSSTALNGEANLTFTGTAFTAESTGALTTVFSSLQNTANALNLTTTGGVTAGIFLAAPTADHSFGFQTGGTERMRIDSTGEFLVNRTDGFGTGGAAAMFVTGRSDAAIYVTGPNTSGYTLMSFHNGGLNQIGSIKNSSNSAVIYATSSDYRLKENVDYTWDATTRLKQLKPARFNWISDAADTTVDGFLAHEVSSIVPEAIDGVKDATKTSTNCVLNAEGNLYKAGITEAEWTAGKEDSTYESDTSWTASHTQNIYQGIDQSKLVPLLVKTIQELEARITTLENA
tara:strand:+ start:23 stop:1165 length:1143 start_codon:yes stop_codon:yes gene_type:complete